jgi:dephospho-CoA kinase
MEETMGRERRESQAGRTVVAVGLTGSIGAGKSTVLALFSECGALVFSADQLVHELYECPVVTSQVAEHFGAWVLDGAGSVDRARLAEAVRGRPAELHWLEGLTHPMVATEIAHRVEAAPQSSVVVCEVPLLVESGFESLFDLIVTVEAGSEVRRLRSTHHFGLEQFAELEALQASREQRVRGSDLVVANDGDLDQLGESVREAFAVARGMLRPAPDGERA